MSYITNSADILFHAAGRNGAAAALTVTHGSMIFRYGQADALLLWTGALIVPRSLQAGDPIRMPSGAFDLNILAGAQGVNDSAIKAALDALYSSKQSSITALLGTASMGSTGVSNEVTDANYARQTFVPTIALGSAPSG